MVRYYYFWFVLTVLKMHEHGCLRYTPQLRRITFKAITFVNVTCVFHSHSRLQQQSLFFDLQNTVRRGMLCRFMLKTD